jgi:hypothetical protein
MSLVLNLFSFSLRKYKVEEESTPVFKIGWYGAVLTGNVSCLEAAVVKTFSCGDEVVIQSYP